MKTFTFFSLLIALAGNASAQGAPKGTKGQDWDEKTIEIKNNVGILITGQVTTTDTVSGNTSSVILYIDGVEVRRSGGERAQSTVSYRYSQNGRHHIRIVCDNTRATAENCILNISRDKIEVYE